MQGLQALLASRRKRRRAVVSLPTGGGKTRVTVEASVRLVLATRATIETSFGWRRPMNSCEHAVQAFR